MELKLTGMEALTNKLRGLQQEVSGPGMERALRAGGRVIRGAMQERAPVLDRRTPGSTALPPGSLRAGIRVYAPKDVKPIEVLVGPNAKTAHVARFVEYGHRQVSGGQLKVLPNGKTHGKGKAGRDVPPHPFLRPAFEASLGAAETAMVASLKETIEKAG